jgi:hypothetical protein
MKYLLGRKSDNYVFNGREWILPTNGLIVTNCAALTSKLAILNQYRFDFYLNNNRYPSKAELQDIKYIKVKGANAYEIME